MQMQHLCCIWFKCNHETTICVSLLHGHFLPGSFVAPDLLARQPPALPELHLGQSGLLTQGLRIFAVEHVYIPHVSLPNGTCMFHHLTARRF